MINKDLLTELERKKAQLLDELSNTKMAISRILRPLPQFRVDAWDGSETLEDGINKIDAPAEMVEKIEEIESGHKGNLIKFKDGTTKPIEEYFTTEQIESIRKW